MTEKTNMDNKLDTSKQFQETSETDLFCKKMPIKGPKLLSIIKGVQFKLVGFFKAWGSTTSYIVDNGELSYIRYFTKCPEDGNESHNRRLDLNIHIKTYISFCGTMNSVPGH